MRIVFVDESGDVGGIGSPTRHFVLVALVVEHASWDLVQEKLAAMREGMQARHGLRLDAEIHASEFLGGSDRHLGLNFRQRYRCLRLALQTLKGLPGTHPVRAAATKVTGASNVLDATWGCLLDELDDLIAQTPTAACPSKGTLMICDHHATLPYRPSAAMLARMNPRSRLRELPFGRDSADCLPLQMADLLAYLTKQSLAPNGYFSKSEGRALLRLSESLFGKACRVEAL